MINSPCSEVAIVWIPVLGGQQHVKSLATGLCHLRASAWPLCITECWTRWMTGPSQHVYVLHRKIWIRYLYRCFCVFTENIYTFFVFSSSGLKMLHINYQQYFKWAIYHAVNLSEIIHQCNCLCTFAWMKVGLFDQPIMGSYIFMVTEVSKMYFCSICVRFASTKSCNCNEYANFQFLTKMI